MQEILFRGKKMYFIDERIHARHRIPEFNYYELRHTDSDFSKPCEITRGVLVNFFGTVATRHQLSEFAENKPDTNDVIYILDDEVDREFDKAWQIDFFGKEVTEDMEEYSLFY